jgi:hypothetical protein
MPEPMEPQMDRYLRGDLSPTDARALAQTALDRPDLFEELTLAAVATHGLAAQPATDPLESYVSGHLAPLAQRELAQAALTDGELFDALVVHAAVEKGFERPKVVRFPRKAWAVVIAAIAAAVVAVAIYLRPPALETTLHATSASLDPTAGKPILLARDLSPNPTSDAAAPVFRSAEAGSRAPRPEGSVVATDNFIITVNLGSLDGLAKGTRLEVFHGKQPMGTLEVTTVFRDRARGLIPAGVSIQANDIVRPPASVYDGAVLEQMNADPANARKLGRAALAAGPNQKILDRLAQLDYQSGDTKSAEQDYQSIIDNFNSPPEALNNLGVLNLLSGDTAQAEAKFHALHDARALNNLGVAAELRGDKTTAHASYREALRALEDSSSSPRDRQTIEANLARLAGAAHDKP